MSQSIVNRYKIPEGCYNMTLNTGIVRNLKVPFCIYFLIVLNLAGYFFFLIIKNTNVGIFKIYDTLIKLSISHVLNYLIHNYCNNKSTQIVSYKKWGLLFISVC